MRVESAAIEARAFFLHGRELPGRASNQEVAALAALVQPEQSCAPNRRERRPISLEFPIDHPVYDLRLANAVAAENSIGFAFGILTSVALAARPHVVLHLDGPLP